MCIAKIQLPYFYGCMKSCRTDSTLYTLLHLELYVTSLLLCICSQGSVLILCHWKRNVVQGPNYAKAMQAIALVPFDLTLLSHTAKKKIVWLYSTDRP